MITIFGTPRPFRGHFGLIQRNAIASWMRLTPRPQVLIMGDEEGAAEACAELGVTHVPDFERNEFGTPLVSSMIARAEDLAEHRLLAMVSTDIILFDDTMAAADTVSRRFARFCAVVCKKNLDIQQPIDFDDADWAGRIRRSLDATASDNLVAGDFFLFPRGFWKGFPPFAIGRTIVDNWMFYRTLALDGALVNMTSAVTIVHQQHDYSHHPQGQNGVWQGVEAQRNLALAGGRKHVFSIADANWLLTPMGLKRPPLTIQRFRRHLDTYPALHPSLHVPFVGLRALFSPQQVPQHIANVLARK